MTDSLFPDPPAFEMVKDALISPCGLYRYWLLRLWDPEKPLLCWIMLNPSTADAKENDPTIRRCITFAEDLGYGGIKVVNLFAFRSTDAFVIYEVADPVGPDNDAAILAAAKECPMRIAAWGTNGTLKDRDKKVLSMLAKDGIEVHALSVTQKGHPGHPLYLAKTCQPAPYRGV